jgi:hypothetical protein
MLNDTLSDIGLIAAKQVLDDDFNHEIRQGVISAVQETDFAFNKRTGWDYGIEGQYPTLEETLEELMLRHQFVLERKIDWEAIRQTPSGTQRAEAVARQACTIMKGILKNMSEQDLDIDRIPF